MIPEEALERKGESVIVMDEQGNELLGTIEFGSIHTGCISVYTERNGRSGGRVIVRDFSRLRSDPGGERPCWKSML